MKDVYFFTGYPGFLASRLTQQLIMDHHQEIEHIYLLTLPHLKEMAEKQIKSLIKKVPLDHDFFTIVEGDITRQDLNIKQEINDILLRNVTHVFHLAAIYDLAVPEDAAYKVNVEGTRNVNQWVTTLENLDRYIYFSTAYVAGKREGQIYEHELIEGQSFKNHYELTKYQAEILVKQLMIKGIPTTIIRPGVVKGNSKSGETSKFDGLYFMLNFLDHLRPLPTIPYFGDGKAEGNFVPADYVLRAASYLSIHPIGEGKTYHLTDPHPYKMWELQKMICEYYLGKTPKGKIPIPIAKAPLLLKSIRKWLRVEPEAMDYFVYESSFDTSQATADLKESGITCPDLKDTLCSMIEFYRKYKDDKTRHIEIN